MFENKFDEAIEKIAGSMNLNDESKIRLFARFMADHVSLEAWEYFLKCQAEVTNELGVTVELSDGGVIEWDSTDGTIRSRDAHGNSEGVWIPGEPEYDRYKSDYFPNHKVIDEDELIPSVSISPEDGAEYAVISTANTPKEYGSGILSWHKFFWTAEHNAAIVKGKVMTTYRDENGLQIHQRIELDEFEKAYLEAALFSSLNESNPNNVVPLDNTHTQYATSPTKPFAKWWQIARSFVASSWMSKSSRRPSIATTPVHTTPFNVPETTSG